MRSKIATLSTALEEARADIRRLEERLEAVTGDLAAATNKLSYLHHDDIGRAQATAEDALAGAANAREWAEQSAERAARAEGQGADGVARAEARSADAFARADVALDTAREALLPARVAAFTTWLELAPPAAGPMLSVVLPTRDRPVLLPRAVASVLEQLYDDWELVVVDDGDTDTVARVLTDVEDDRVVIVEGPRRGPDAARNAGLDRATGDVVCYLDDDNVMHPAWLRAVAHVFTARPDVDVAYGVTLAEHRTPDAPDGEGWWPTFWQLPWSREVLLEQNVADMGAVAHRRELPGARFQEGTATAEDWDLLIRLTGDRPALAVPALSHAYSLSGEDHGSRAAKHRDALEKVRQRHADG